jgi:hypothetical protein
MKKIFLFLILMRFVMCSEPYHFKEPQPAFTPDEDHFNRRFLGYFGTDSTIAGFGNFFIGCKVSSFGIWYFATIDGKTSRNFLDTSHLVTFRNDSIEFGLLDHPRMYPTKSEQNTVSFHIEDSSLIFTVSDSNRLRSYENDHYLNYRTDKNFWWVERIRIDHDTLAVYRVVPLKGFSGLWATDSTTATPMKLKKNEFKEFVSKGGFSRLYDKYPRKK